MIKRLLLVLTLLWTAHAAAQTTTLLASGGLGVSCNAVATATSVNPGLAGGCTSLAIVTSGNNLPSVVTWQVITTGSPASIAVNLMGSLDGTVWAQADTTTAAGTRNISSVAYRFYGCVPATLSGGSSPTVTCQISLAAGGGLSTAVTSVVCGTGLTGGTITSTGTCALSTPVSAANGGAANVTTLGGTFLASDGQLSNNVMASNLAVSGGTANKIEGIVFVQKYTQVVGHLSVRTGTSLGAGALWSAGVYDSTGTLAFYTGALDGTITTLQTVTAKNAAGSPISYTMNPGVYYLVVTATVIGAGNTVGWQFSPSQAVVNQFINNANANRQIISATNTVSAVLPSAIGTLSASAANISFVAIFVEP